MKKSADLSRSPVQVTRSALPPLDSYMECVRDIFDSHWLTNQGKYVQRLEKDLAQWLDVPMLALCSNGTIALQQKGYYHPFHLRRHALVPALGRLRTHTGRY